MDRRTDGLTDRRTDRQTNKLRYRGDMLLKIALYHDKPGGHMIDDPDFSLWLPVLFVAEWLPSSRTGQKHHDHHKTL